MNQNKIIIPLPLPTLNEYTNSNRTHYHQGAKIKKQATRICKAHISKAVEEGFQLTNLPVQLKCTWYVKDKRKDPDNIAFGIKFILDGATAAKLIPNDGWNEIKSITHIFEIDKSFQRVEIEEVNV